MASAPSSRPPSSGFALPGPRPPAPEAASKAARAGGGVLPLGAARGQGSDRAVRIVVERGDPPYRAEVEDPSHRAVVGDGDAQRLPSRLQSPRELEDERDAGAVEVADRGDVEHHAADAVGEAVEERLPQLGCVRRIDLARDPRDEEIVGRLELEVGEPAPHARAPIRLRRITAVPSAERSTLSSSTSCSINLSPRECALDGSRQLPKSRTVTSTTSPSRAALTSKWARPTG